MGSPTKQSLPGNGQPGVADRVGFCCLSELHRVPRRSYRSSVSFLGSMHAREHLQMLEMSVLYF